MELIHCALFFQPVFLSSFPVAFTTDASPLPGLSVLFPFLHGWRDACLLFLCPPMTVFFFFCWPFHALCSSSSFPPTPNVPSRGVSPTHRTATSSFVPCTFGLFTSSCFSTFFPPLYYLFCLCVFPTPNSSRNPPLPRFCPPCAQNLPVLDHFFSSVFGVLYRARALCHHFSAPY